MFLQNKTNKPKRINSILISSVCFFLVLVNIFFYPTWKKSNSQATLSWDAAGYYAYLPATFIYHELPTLQKTKQLTIDNKYQDGDFYTAFKSDNGNYVMKYSMGNALMMMPYFFAAHAWALQSNIYKADGFSMPYQACISWGCLLYTILALLLLQKMLLRYFKDSTVTICLLLLMTATNYLEYSAITGGLTHNQLFFLYTLLIYFTIKFYDTQKFIHALAIGFVIGLAVLIRPTEFILIAIPLLWKIDSWIALKNRMVFIQKHFSKYFSAAAIALAVISCQLFYWKWVSGHWLVYSYGDQHFDWLKPHIYLGLFSIRKGWYVYTPLMFVATFGFYFLFKKHKDLFWVCLFFMFCTIYVVFSWSLWTYANSYGQRAMIQSYAIMIFPLAAFIEWLNLQKRFFVFIGYAILILFIYLNLNFIWQAHYAKYFEGDNMTKRFFFRTIGRWNIQTNDLKLLDTEEEFKGERKQLKILCSIDSTVFETNHNQQFSKNIILNFNNHDYKWIRATGNFYTSAKEWNNWKMPQLIIRFKNENVVVKERMIRLSRLFDADGNWHQIFLDEKIPAENFSTCEIQLWNADSETSMQIKNLIVECFN